MSSSVHIDNKNKHILIIGDEETRRLDDTTLKAEAKDCINFKSTLNGNSFLFVNTIKIYQFEAKAFEKKKFCPMFG